MHMHMAERAKLKATIHAMKQARQRGTKVQEYNENVLKPEEKERSFRQQQEFGAKKRIKP